MIVYGLLVAGTAAALYHFRVRLPRKKAEPLIACAESFCRDTLTSGAESHPEQTVVFLGDSLMLGVGVTCPEETLAHQIACQCFSKPVRLVNLAENKARAADVCEQVKKLRFLRQGKIMAFILVGGNGALHNTDKDKFIQHLAVALKTLHQDHDGRIRIFLCLIPDLSFVPALRPCGGLLNRRVKVLNREIARMARLVGPETLALVDIYTTKLDRSEHYASDGFHASPAGYRQWINSFKAALGKESPTYARR